MTLLSKVLKTSYPSVGYEVYTEEHEVEFHAEVIDAPAGEEQETQALVDDINSTGRQTIKSEIAYTLDGKYIGSPEYAHKLCVTHGIIPTIISAEHNVCSIGFCPHEQQWYGWSHRAMYGFGIGSKVEPGNCAYAPTDKEDFRLDCVRFWRGEPHVYTWAVEERGPDGEYGVLVSWYYSDSVPNEKLRGTLSGTFMPYPETWGHGSWTARSLEDARQMAIDFANGVG